MLARLVRGSEIAELTADLPNDYAMLRARPCTAAATRRRRRRSRPRDPRSRRGPRRARRSSAGATALSGKTQRRCRSTSLILRVAEREGVSTEQALDCAQTVFATLREATADKEWSELLVESPRGYAEALT